MRQKTCALHNACETLLHEQTRLTDNAEAIHEKLSYFQELDSIKSRLKNPNLEVNSGLVKSAQFVWFILYDSLKIIQPAKEQFLALLAKLDSCIEYMSKNSQFKDSAQFLIKFNNCLTQVLGQIKTHVMRTLESSTNNLLGKSLNPYRQTFGEWLRVFSGNFFQNQRF